MKKLSLHSLLLIATIASTMAAESDVPKRFGKVIAVSGKATATKPDGAKVAVKVGDELPAGSTIQTENGTVDLFFRRIGTIMQVQENSALSLDKLEMSVRDGKLIKRTEIAVKEGVILSCVRVLIPDSKVIVRTKKTTFHVPGTGMGRFEFRADGSALVGRKSKLTLIADVGNEPIAVMPGQFFDGKSTNATAANPTVFAAFTPKMDALQNTASKLTPPPAAEELPN